MSANGTVSKDPQGVLTGALVKRIRGQFQLHWRGMHGAPHWARVRRVGLELAAETGAEPIVIELFSFLHDSRRLNDGHDPKHGLRAANFAAELYEGGHLGHCDIDDGAMQRLISACLEHSEGGVEGHPTVQTCWDADRLDLGRVGIRPDPRYLCTDAARDPARIERCWRASRSNSR